MIRLTPFLIAAAIVASTLWNNRIIPHPYHVRYEKGGHEITEQEYRREFEKSPGSVTDCYKDPQSKKVSCADG